MRVNAEITPVEPDLDNASEGNIMTELSLDSHTNTFNTNLSNSSNPYNSSNPSNQSAESSFSTQRKNSLPSCEKPVIPRVLSIAGTDPTGGAGIQADLKSIMASDGFGMCVTTNLVAQNTCGVREVYTPPTSFLVSQLEAVFDDVKVDAVKLGMLGDKPYIDIVGEWLENHPVPVVVLDPVMVATSGDRLLKESAEESLRLLIKKADIITPNIPELAVLCNSEPATSFNQALEQAKILASENNVIVIVKGGHLTGKDAGNTAVFPDGTNVHVPSRRVDTKTTHGTGCSLSSSLATRVSLALKNGKTLENPATVSEALTWTTHWLNEAIRNGEDLHVGKGHGPVNHAARQYRLELDSSTTPWEHLKDDNLINLDGSNPETCYVVPKTLPRKPKICAAGRWTQALWNATADVDFNIMNLDFIKSLGDGSLDEDLFDFYLNQDAEYLKRYSRALAATAAKTQDDDARVHWSSSAAACIEAESELHRSWFKKTGTAMKSACSPATLAYVNHLLATTFSEDYVVAVAAILPCYWLYEEVGHVLVEKTTPDNPYNDWISMYSSKEFDASVRKAIECVEKAFEQASPSQRILAVQAYMTSCVYEYDFFNQAHRSLR